MWEKLLYNTGNRPALSKQMIHPWRKSFPNKDPFITAYTHAEMNKYVNRDMKLYHAISTL